MLGLLNTPHGVRYGSFWLEFSFKGIQKGVGSYEGGFSRMMSGFEPGKGTSARSLSETHGCVGWHLRLLRCCRLAVGVAAFALPVSEPLTHAVGLRDGDGHVLHRADCPGAYWLPHQ